MTSLINVLAKHNAIRLLELIHKSLLCTKEEELRELILDLKDLISYDYAICGFAKIDNNGRVKSYKIINISYPVEWFDLYLTRKYYQIDPIVKENFTKFQLQCRTAFYETNCPQKNFLSMVEDFGTKKGYTFGMRYRTKNEGSIFSITGKFVERKEYTKIILENIVPHFHQALIRILNLHKNVPLYLSSREKEVLNWIQKGKSSWDISIILNISERTVNFHIRNILQKLDVVNRPQAIAVAIERGIVDIE